MSTHHTISKDKLALSLTGLLTGCGDPLVGDWELVDIRPGGLSISYSYSGYDGSCGSYSYDLDAELYGLLAIDSELEARFELDIALSYEYDSDFCGSDSVQYTYEYTYSGKAERDGDTYEIRLRDDTESMDLSCKLDGSELRCEAEDETYIFEQL
ncbi:MAG: hypothetical protein IPN01_27400 [Deltaproteobacteria bacterium]|nr:hypothetical protein [Deltaproteobacteria bacterium]